MINPRSSAIVFVVASHASSALAAFTFTTIDYPGSTGSALQGISNAGHLVGQYDDEFGIQHGYSLKDGVYQPYDYPDAVWTSMLGVNSAGQMVGVYQDIFGRVQAFRRVGDTTTPLVPSATSTYTQANNINETGHIVGSYYTGGVNRGFLFNGTSYTLGINVPGTVDTVALGINSSDTMVGTYKMGDGINHGFHRTGSTYTTINYPGMPATIAYGINDSGQVAGFYFDPSNVRHGFLLSGGVYSTVEPPDGFTSQVQGINNAGQLVGSYYDTSIIQHGFIATPQLAGDFNSDGKVDAADYAKWRKTDGAVSNYSLWRANFGAPGSGSYALSFTVVPEPAAGIGGFIAACTLIGCRRLMRRPNK